ncbi:3-methylornithyl-N6-L-lysine dehydrogenase PylD [Sporomusa malonica]|uniref:Pyrrolysine biosynthesis protein PylD n=1 Tax=Sporomusa malonica TaxID=112901 RepID=A0A1W2BE48_9FIRM|nr:3-methylornithyl-N6-L-lysine dehydrogenase PylD [Sporomusa malonica]SMC71303.1 pyrrolysine biosynthesis protein PylD [Sporomusa malonica]
MAQEVRALTRLREEDICHVDEMLSEYDQRLCKRVGQGLAGIAAHSLGRSAEEFAGLRQHVSIGVIPIAYGQGIIHGFSRSVQKIIEFLGFNAFVTDQNNIAGLAEAAAKGAKIIFLADDDKFVAINVASGKVSDNGEATGRGYAAALDLMSGGLQGESVLLVGTGPVGTGAALFMAARGAQVFAYDVSADRVRQLQQLIPGVEAVRHIGDALSVCKLVVEATPAANTINKKYITPATMIAAPGIPLGLDQHCCLLLGDRWIHDVLEIGVATMLFTVLAD